MRPNLLLGSNAAAANAAHRRHTVKLAKLASSTTTISESVQCARLV